MQYNMYIDISELEDVNLVLHQMALPLNIVIYFTFYVSARTAYSGFFFLYVSGATPMLKLMHEAVFMINCQNWQIHNLLLQDSAESQINY